MKNFALIATYLLFGSMLMFAACSGNRESKLKGNWHSKDGSIKLKITGKQIITNNDTSAAEEYLLKNDTILTSFEGNRPFTRMVIQKLDDNNMQLLYPDSISIEFGR